MQFNKIRQERLKPFINIDYCYKMYLYGFPAGKWKIWRKLSAPQAPECTHLYTHSRLGEEEWKTWKKIKFCTLRYSHDMIRIRRNCIYIFAHARGIHITAEYGFEWSNPTVRSKKMVFSATFICLRTQSQTTESHNWNDDLTLLEGKLEALGVRIFWIKVIL